MSDPPDYNYTWRATCAQVVAIVAFHTMMLNVGLIIAMPSVMIGALQRPADPAHAAETAMAFTESQASWFGSLLFVAQPLGSVASGVLQGRLGRKRCLLLVNACQLAAWLLMCHATSTHHLFAGLLLLGLTIGFEEAPVLSYLGEVAEPRLRGLASSSGGVFFNLGLILGTGLGYAYSSRWRAMLRRVALTPLLAFFALSLVPESPTWLVSEGRAAEALRSFQWLRGWVPADRVRRELDDTVAYVRKSSTAQAHDRRWRTEWRLLCGPSVQRPMRLIVFFFFVSCCTALVPLRPFVVPLLQQLHSPVDAFQANMWGSVLSLGGAVTASALLPWLGKRRLTFASLFVCLAGCVGLALCLAAPAPARPDLVLWLLGLVAYGSSCGVIPVPWILISELFPLRAKGLASGVAAAAGYLVLFLTTGSYHWLVSRLSAGGAVLAYAAVGLPGAVYLYLVLPETEGVPLEVAERLMADGREKRGDERQEEAEAGQRLKVVGLLDTPCHERS